jgi:hypothetical protein
MAGHHNLCTGFHTRHKRHRVGLAPLVVGEVAGGDRSVRVGKHHAVPREVLQSLGNFVDIGSKRHHDMLCHNLRVRRKRAGVDVSTGTPGHIRHHTKVHVGSRAIDQLLAREEGFRGGVG